MYERTSHTSNIKTWDPSRFVTDSSQMILSNYSGVFRTNFVVKYIKKLTSRQHTVFRAFMLRFLGIIG